MCQTVKHGPHKKLISLSAIEKVGIAEYPRLAQLAYVPAAAIDKRIALAAKAQLSLLIRLLTRRPLLVHYICHMQLDRNLRCLNERWVIQFRAGEMNASAHQSTRGYRVPFPEDLVPQLEEFLTIWRPMLPGSDVPELFTSLAGRPYSSSALNNVVRNVVRAYTGCAADVRRVRAIWAIEFLKTTGDFVAAAEVLGETTDTIVRRFGHLRRAEPGVQADRFFSKHVTSQS
jgi:hypothetical protein